METILFLQSFDAQLSAGKTALAIALDTPIQHSLLKKVLLAKSL
jgi:hypothetical protein